MDNRFRWVSVRALGAGRGARRIEDHRNTSRAGGTGSPSGASAGSVSKASDPAAVPQQQKRWVRAGRCAGDGGRRSALRAMHGDLGSPLTQNERKTRRFLRDDWDRHGNRNPQTQNSPSSVTTEFARFDSSRATRSPLASQRTQPLRCGHLRIKVGW